MDEKQLIKSLQQELDRAMEEYRKRSKQLYPDQLATNFDVDDPICIQLYGYILGLNKAIEIARETKDEN